MLEKKILGVHKVKGGTKSLPTVHSTVHSRKGGIPCADTALDVYSVDIYSRPVREAINIKLEPSELSLRLLRLTFALALEWCSAIAGISYCRAPDVALHLVTSEIISTCIWPSLGCRLAEIRKLGVGLHLRGGVMGNTCACIRHSEVDAPSRKDGSVEAGHNETAPAAFEGERGTSSSLMAVVCDGSESYVPGARSAIGRSDVEDRIESSKVHWSELTERESDLDDEEVAQENREVFEELQSHPTWGGFFKTFGYDTKEWQRFGEVVVGEKFAEGGQAELFHAKVIWRDPKENEEDLEDGREWVLKVFKAGTRLRELQSQWPIGYLQLWVEDLERSQHNLPPRTLYCCDVYCGTLLEDGRFAFLMAKEHEDLRSRIDQAMLSIGKDRGPFSKDEVERIMYSIAEGMHWLHSRNIVHRDLKAGNVLVCREVGYNLKYYVADFECSIGVVGTGFFRAPEILQALKDGVASKHAEVFSKEADVYGYSMTCYEVLTGKLPFQGHPNNSYDLVINGHRPSIPKYVDNWIRELLRRCWDVDCSKRPSFAEIMKIVSSNSTEVRRLQVDMEEWEENRIRKHGGRSLQ